MRDAGARVVVVSNWDRSLPGALDQAGLGALVDGVVSSAEVGHAKPAPEPFRAGLELAGVEAAEALFVGDSPETDIEGAQRRGHPRHARGPRRARRRPASSRCARSRRVPSLF